MTIINLAKKASARHARLHGRDAQTLPVKPADFSVNLFDRFVACGISFLLVPAGLPSAGKGCRACSFRQLSCFRRFDGSCNPLFKQIFKKSPVSSQAGVLLLLREGRKNGICDKLKVRCDKLKEPL